MWGAGILCIVSFNPFFLRQSSPLRAAAADVVSGLFWLRCRLSVLVDCVVLCFGRIYCPFGPAVLCCVFTAVIACMHDTCCAVLCLTTSTLCMYLLAMLRFAWQVVFLQPVDVGDLVHLEACVLYTKPG